jgi:oligoribonuclease NrnB/cAMP/cGMP phosphodiesterase (DHH superfamily)
MSAAIVKHWFKQNNNCFTGTAGAEIITKIGDTLSFIGYNYGQPIPDLAEYDEIIMCDISFPSKEMLKLEKRLNDNFVWIDHHYGAFETMKKDIVDYILYPFRGLQDIKFAACELTWKYFFPNETMPEIVRLLGRYDCFGHKGTNEETKVLEFQYGARQVITNYKDAYMWLHSSINYNNANVEDIDKILSIGHYTYKYLCAEATQIYRNGFEIQFPKIITEVPKSDVFPNNPVLSISGAKKVKFICINKERFNPINFGINYHAEGYDGAACFHYDGTSKLWRFSLYNDNGEVDCSLIAKQYGGGGHKGASGFVLNTEQFLKFLNDNIK